MMGAAFGGEGDVNVTISAQNDTNGAIDGVIENLARLRQAGFSANEALEQMGNGLGGGIGGGGMGGITGLMRGFDGALRDVIGSMGHWISTTTAMYAAMAGMQVFNEAAQAVRNLGDEMWNLQVKTEANVYSWRYTYGTRPDQAAAMGISPQDLPAHNLKNAQDISHWSSLFSMNIPFTRQDLMSSISSFSAMGMNLPGLEKYFPMIADLAATHTDEQGNPIDLGQAVMAIRGESMGISRMLKYKLNINPEDLVQYGLAWEGRGIGGHLTDKTTLLPALLKYSQAMGFTSTDAGDKGGAAYAAAHNTWWGEASSFQDRMQNWLLNAGGTDLFGNVREGSLFGVMKKDLEGISQWMDDHQGQLNKLADMASQFFGGAVHGTTSLFEGMFKGLEQSPFAQQVLDDITNAGKWLADPTNQQKLKDFGTAIGTNLGGALEKADGAFKDLKSGWDDLKNAMGPESGPTIFNGITSAIAFLISQAGTLMHVFADLANVMEDIADRNWTKLHDDAIKAGADILNLTTMGTQKQQVDAMKNQLLHGPNTPETVTNGNGNIPSNVEHWGNTYQKPGGSGSRNPLDPANQFWGGAGGIETILQNPGANPWTPFAPGAGNPTHGHGVVDFLLGLGGWGGMGDLGVVNPTTNAQISSQAQMIGTGIISGINAGVQQGMAGTRGAAASIGQSIADEIRRAFAGGQHLGIGDAIAAAVKREIDGAAGYGSVTAGGSWAALGTLGGFGR